MLIKIEYAALNRADLMQREGDYPPPAGCPEWMGLEVSGEIVEMTEGAKAKSNYEIGDKVCALLGGGGYAEYVSVRHDMCMPVPKNCTMAEAAGRAIDIAIDCLGGQNLGECLPYVKYGCRWIVIAALAGVNTTIDLKNIYKKNIRIIGSTLRSRTQEMKAQILANLVSDVWGKVEKGEVKPTIYKILPITDAEAAHDILYRGENVGKVVLKLP